MKIINIKALEILDSRANPTVQVEIILEDGSKGIFRVPSGASTGIHEACELRDNNKNIYHGKSVQKAIKNINIIKNKLIGYKYTQETLDEELIKIDNTKNKTNIGANAILGISVAFSKASAKYYNLPLHEYLYRLINEISFKSKKIQNNLKEIHLFANVINGGLHSGNQLNIQEFMIIPIFGTIKEKIRAISEIYNTLKELIAKKYGPQSTAVGDEGGFAPDISKPEEALDLLILAIKDANYTGDIALALDSAASDFYNEGTKKYEVEKGKKLNYKDLTQYYNKLIAKYPIISIEDSMSEDDFSGFAYYLNNVIKNPNMINPLLEFTIKRGKKSTNKISQENYTTLSVGDDLLVTNPQRIKMAQEKKLCNSLLLKINQIGTLSESIKAHKMAKENNWHTIVSHRSGETSDDFIADLAVAMQCSIKIGAPARGERVAKYNRLLNIYSSK